jgi:hypothetical protein
LLAHDLLKREPRRRGYGHSSFGEAEEVFGEVAHAALALARSEFTIELGFVHRQKIDGLANVLDVIHFRLALFDEERYVLVGVEEKCCGHFELQPIGVRCKSEKFSFKLTFSLVNENYLLWV